MDRQVYQFDLSTPMHLISMSTKPGRVLTTTHLSWIISCMSLKTDQVDSRSRRLRLTPVGLIHVVHLVKVGNIREKDINLHHVLETRTSFVQDGTKVLNTLMLEIVLARVTLRLTKELTVWA